MRYRWLVLSTGLLLIAFITPALSEIVKGQGVLERGCWDFSQELTVTPWDTLANACVFYVVDPPLGYMVTAFGYGAITVTDSAFDDVTTAPEDSLAWVFDYPAFTFLTYIVRTTDNHYAKFHILQFIPLVTIEYAYQSDGSRNLDTSVPVDATSWGRIKALYQ